MELGPGRSAGERTRQLMVKSKLDQQVESEGVGMGAGGI